MTRRSGSAKRGPACTTIGLFSGIGGLELGFEREGFRTTALCESWAPAIEVLASRFPDVPLSLDVRGFAPHHVDVVLAGFPCTDLSPVGGTAGITGPSSGLVDEVFRIVADSRPRFVVLENVPNMLVLHNGAAMRHIASKFDQLGYRWAYRTVDARFAGLPQRRFRVLLVAARDENPAWRLFRSDAGPFDESSLRGDAFGFYWTEGRGGLGWAKDAIPTLKGGSTIGIPSPPAVYLPNEEVGRQIAILDTADGERLQGFPTGWTSPAIAKGGRDHRWKLLGNAVPVDIAQWIAHGLRLVQPTRPSWREDAITREGAWPPAGRGDAGSTFEVHVSPWPELRQYHGLLESIDRGHLRPLSYRASSGFLRRVDESSLALDGGFEGALQRHVHHMRQLADRGRRWDTGSATRRRMAAVRSKDTGPELELRHVLWGRGLRYYLQRRPVATLRHRADIVFPRSRVVVDVRGCFWHACPEHSTKPKANAERWAAKLQQNRGRDLRVETELRGAGWEVVVVWEHDDIEEAADRIEKLVRGDVRAKCR